jgi:hypothetical protein
VEGGLHRAGLKERNQKQTEQELNKRKKSMNRRARAKKREGPKTLGRKTMAEMRVYVATAKPPNSTCKATPERVRGKHLTPEHKREEEKV